MHGPYVPLAETEAPRPFSAATRAKMAAAQQTQESSQERGRTSPITSSRVPELYDFANRFSCRVKTSRN